MPLGREVWQYTCLVTFQVVVVALHLQKSKVCGQFTTVALATVPLVILSYINRKRSNQRQSPIDIVTQATQTDDNIRGLHINYKADTGAIIRNTGHSVQISISKDCNSVISGGPLSDEYTLVQFHFHWGHGEGRGGEHTIDGQQYDAELHFVHFKSEYGSFADALNKDDGLAVLAIMIKVGEENLGINQVTSLLCDITKCGGSTSQREMRGSLDCTALMPANLNEYFTYLGSLTTPPFTESVTWIVFSEAVEISKQQMENFRKLEDEHGKSMGDNFREVQPLHGRIVKNSF